MSRSKEALLNIAALARIRLMLQHTLGQHDFWDFFVIAPDYINIGSMRSENIGGKNLPAGFVESSV